MNFYQDSVCEDFDECEKELGCECEEQQTCVNTFGSYSEYSVKKPDVLNMAVKIIQLTRLCYTIW